MRDKVCFASIDIEHDFSTAGNKTFFGIQKVDDILEVFKKFDVRATLFISGDVLEKFPEYVKKWAEDYEIASHSYAHRYFNELTNTEKENDFKRYSEIYNKLFGENPKGFRAPSHVIDAHTFKLLEEYGFLYDSSVVPHYPPFKKYRGYSGKAPVLPYVAGMVIELPVSGQLLGFPLAGAWLRKLPTFFYRILFAVNKPQYITLSMHSWDVLDIRFYLRLIRIIGMLKKNGYVFKNGKQIATYN